MSQMPKLLRIHVLTPNGQYDLRAREEIAMRFIMAVATGLMVVAFVGVATWLLFAGGAESQQQRPEFAGVPADVLEKVGVELTLPVQAQGLISENEARAALEREYPFWADDVKQIGVANLKDRAAAPYYNGSAWVVSLDTTGRVDYAPGEVNGPPIEATVAWHLVFFDARTGEYIGDIQLNDYNKSR